MIFFRKDRKYSKVAIVTKEEDPYHLEKLIKKHGFKISKKPDFVIAEGGDGTILISEREFPGIPKLIIKDSNICNQLPDNHPINELLTKIASNTIEIIEHDKLEAHITQNNKKLKPLVCANEFNIRNQLLIQALRFKLFIDDEEPLDELIGDGVVICTPFGSKAYYKSITKKDFDSGIGIGLNNVTIPKTGIHTKDDRTIKIEITRMPVDFAVDNSINILTLEPGDTIEIKKSKEKMRLIKS